MLLKSILQEYWGFPSFRPLQEEIINSVLSGKDTLALLPTGGGKSLCYQVPAMARPGLCLVVSPLIALMKDQVENLRKKGITAYAIYSGMSRKDVVNTLQVCGSSNCKFLYVSPERLETNLFKEYLPALNINLLAIDEAHCISQWGYDFRPPYLRIATLRDELPAVPVLALTASATPEVQKDVCEKLHFKNENIFRQSFERPNLSYSVFKVDSKANKMLEIIKNVQGCGIVYCRSRRRTQEISELLSMHGISSDFYHAGLQQSERNSKQLAWINDTTRVIVCTNAFGMGIDKPDVRSVIHADVPDSLENYYQEAGRAGRDGKKSYAVLLYDESDIKEPEELVNSRYPAIENIRIIYSAVCNYLQVPAGSSEGLYFDFDLADFIKKFKLNSHTVLYSLKALEQDGWISYNEQVFLPSTVRFTASRNDLFEFEKNNPALDTVIKTLLRAYEGIFDFATVISEKYLASLLKTDEAAVKTSLSLLHRQAVIDYRPQKDNPQIGFLRERIKAEHLQIDLGAYEKRKQTYRDRVTQMNAYVKEQMQCRSKLIGRYFGDEELTDCLICDNCLRKKAIVIDKEEFETINNRIFKAIQEPIPAKELLSRLSGIRKEKAWKVLDHLQAENKIELDKKGWVRRK